MCPVHRIFRSRQEFLLDPQIDQFTCAGPLRYVDIWIPGTLAHNVGPAAVGARRCDARFDSSPASGESAPSLLQTAGRGAAARC